MSLLQEVLHPLLMIPVRLDKESCVRIQRTIMRGVATALVLSKVRSILEILRKEWERSDSSEELKGIVEGLIQVQSQLRLNGGGTTVEPLKVTLPILTLLRAGLLGPPYRLVALEALQTIISHDILMEDVSQAEDAVFEIVDALTANSSDANGGQSESNDLVQLQILQTMDCLIKSSTSAFLNDETAWSLVRSIHDTLVQAASSGKTSVYQYAGRVSEDIISFIFTRNSLYHENGLSGNGDRNEGRVGTVCALKALTFFVGILEQHASRKDVLEDPSTRRGASSYSAKAPSALDLATVELLLALKAIHAIILVDGNGRFIKERGGLLLLTPVFVRYVRDDLGRFLVVLAGQPGVPLMALEIILGIFTTILSVYGPVLRVMVEFFMKQVYLKAAFQAQCLFGEQDVTIASSSVRDSATGPMSPTSKAYMKNSQLFFSISKIEMVLESLVDLVADEGFLPALFATFDCDTTKNDLVQPLIKYISRCVRHSLSSSSVGELGPLDEIGGICMSLYSSLLTSLTDRCNLRDASKDTLASNKQVDLVTQIYKAARQRKVVMSTAVDIFARKPSDAFRYLQEHAILKCPAPSQEVAEFLRYTPGLSMEKVGSYLGELGRPSNNVSHETDGQEFHKQVLADYIATFDFEGLTVLQGIRIFLSAFLLPKEAQQIERIFVALSEHCHASCNECVSGAFENSDVTYLMTMSIIMLNTDRHNVNIKSERKMTCEKFVQVNTNYGRDVNQTRPVEKEYLEGIYNEIGVSPLRTEPDDLSGVITTEMWMEKQLQLMKNPEKGFMLVPSAGSAALEFMSSMFCRSFEETNGALVAAAAKGFISPHATAHALNPLALSAAIVGHPWLFDGDLLSCIWTELLGVGVCPFLVGRMPPRVPDRLQPEIWFRRESTPFTLRAGIDVLMTLLKVADAYSMKLVTDSIVALLAEFAGVPGCTISDGLFGSLKLEYNLTGSSSVSETKNVEAFSKKLLESLEARAALVTLLQIVQSAAGYVRELWPVVWHSLGILRDSVLLPVSMVQMSNADILPRLVRADFEAQLAEHFARAAEDATGAKTQKKAGLLGFLFGGADRTRGAAGAKLESVLGVRWDSGYAPLLAATSSSSPEQGQEVSPDGVLLEGALSAENYASESSGSVYGGDAVRNLRNLVAGCGIDRLVADSKFFPDETLLSFVKAIAAQISRVAPASVTARATGNKSKSAVSAELDVAAHHDERLPPPSAATVAWLENVLVEVALRNRDRFVLLWPTLSEHYSAGLSPTSSLSYAVERRVVGIFQVVERLMARSGHTQPLLALLARLFLLPHQASFRGSVQGDTAPLSESLLWEMSGQISTGMWRTVTRNVEVLPKLAMEQWQLLFDILAFCGSTGGYASIKCFETMVWLLHEPRLRAEVPVFCVVVIKPLLRSKGVPEAVSIGAVKLLMQLHTRLEILVKDKPDEGATEGKPVIWESCWTPILSALTEGVADDRAAVRRHSTLALSSAMADKHVLMVPASVLADILGNILMPAGLLLGERLVEACRQGEGEGSETDKAAQAQKQNRRKEEDILNEVLHVKPAGSRGHSFDEGAASAGSTPSSPAHAGEAGAVASRSPLRTMLVNSDAAGEGSDDSPATVCLQCISAAFMRQLDKLVKHPQFQKLWLRLLHLLSFFLGGPMGFSHADVLHENAVASEVEALRRTIAVARDALANMLRGLIKEGHFKSQGDMWTATQETVSHFTCFEEELKLITKEEVMSTAPLSVQIAKQ